MVAMPPGLSFCIIDDHVIFLDDRQDRYFALAGDKAARFTSLMRQIGDQSTADPDVVAAFVTEGLLTEAIIGSPVLACSAPLARYQCGEQERAPSHSWQVMLALACIVWSLVGLRFRSFRRNISPCGNRGRKSAAHLASRPLQAFTTALRIFPRRLDCLPHALSLRLFLSRLAIHCDLVIGVKEGPFAAHCWIQIDDHLIGDDLDRVHGFTPIRIVS